MQEHARMGNSTFSYATLKQEAQYTVTITD